VRKLTSQQALPASPNALPLGVHGASRPANRRRHRRAQAPAIASLLRADGSIVVWTLRDLSAGGASLVGDAPLAPGERVKLTLHVPGRAPLSLGVRVLRRQLATHARTAVAFEAVSPEDASTLAQVVDVAAERRPDTTINELLVGKGSAAIASIERELTAVGRVVRHVESPVDAAAWLELPDGPTTLLVEEDALVFKGFKLLPHAKQTHPRVRRLVIGNAIQSFRLNLSIRSGLVDGVLEHRFVPGDLLRRLGLSVA
jgi:hypothetical protein